MMKFIYQDDKHSPRVEVTIKGDTHLGEVLSTFEGFLRAATFVFDGTIDIVEEEKGEVNG